MSAGFAPHGLLTSNDANLEADKSATEGSPLAAALWDGCDAALSSRLAYPEVRAALSAAGRAGGLTAADRHRAELAWEDFWASTRPVELSAAVAEHAGRLAGERALRGADAVHLASALAIGGDVIFAAWDERMRIGADESGLRVAPANADPRE